MVKPYLILNALIFHSGVSLTLKVSDSLGCPITILRTPYLESNLGPLVQS